ncbi:hypothetical protein NDU88_002912 [Pleurodeles waltl]|uniref:Uncharacterized protein n=1 Tax=Pleurodeles waltl TaxID=8319 RepID=A0AAV7LFF0_PLEWA|nr:hypothetical protein NDU88_002912 [Pleurodeles waltl]
MLCSFCGWPADPAIENSPLRWIRFFVCLRASTSWKIEAEVQEALEGQEHAANVRVDWEDAAEVKSRPVQTWVAAY